MQIIGDSPYHDFPGIESNAHVQFETLEPSHFFGIVAHGRLHCQSGIART